VTGSDLAGLVGTSGDSSLVILNLDISQSVDLAGNAADLRITGEILARGRVSVPGVSGDATVYFEVASGLAIGETADAGTSLYPNPSSGRTRLSLGNPGLTRVVVYDMLGRQVLERRSDGGSDLDLSGHPPGLYVVVWMSGTQSGSRVLVVIR
jgi:hypothetical protein